jgi:hypothetical protein
MDKSRESISSTETVVYPFCYKIKENCLPCNNNNIISVNNPIDCVVELSKLDKASALYFNKELKQKYLDNLFDCLKKYGDIYKQLNIELYVNPKTKQIIFPDNSRIQSNFNLFIQDNNLDTSSPREADKINNKLMLYSILLNDNLRKKYNEFYYSSDFAELESVMPKEYGIARIMGKETEKEGGKRKKSRKTKTKKNKRKNKLKRRTISRK